MGQSVSPKKEVRDDNNKRVHDNDNAAMFLKLVCV